MKKMALSLKQFTIKNDICQSSNYYASLLLYNFTKHVYIYIYMQRCIIGKYGWTSSNIGFRLIGLNSMYIISVCHCTQFYFDCSIGICMCYNKHLFIKGPVFLYSFIIGHYFINYHIIEHPKGLISH